MTQAPRKFEIDPAERTARQSELVARIEAGPRGRVPINLRAWLHNPDFVDVVEPFGLYVSSLAPITSRQKEIVVLVGARFWQARFEWAMHERHARKAGLTDAQIDAIREGRDPGFDDAKENPAAARRGCAIGNGTGSGSFSSPSWASHSGTQICPALAACSVFTTSMKTTALSTASSTQPRPT